MLHCPVVFLEIKKIESACCRVYDSASVAGNGKDNRLSYTDKILDIMKNIGRQLVLLFDTVQKFSTLCNFLTMFNISQHLRDRYKARDPPLCYANLKQYNDTTFNRKV
jgi:hypothetical protein